MDVMVKSNMQIINSELGQGRPSEGNDIAWPEDCAGLNLAHAKI